MQMIAFFNISIKREWCGLSRLYVLLVKWVNGGSARIADIGCVNFHLIRRGSNVLGSCLIIGKGKEDIERERRN